MSKLSPKQTRFLDAYLVCGSATEAASRAGYRDPRRSGSRLLSTNVRIQGIVASVQEKDRDAAIGAREEALATLTRIWRSDKNSALARINAISIQGKLSGWFAPERHEVQQMDCKGARERLILELEKHMRPDDAAPAPAAVEPDPAPDTVPT